MSDKPEKTLAEELQDEGERLRKRIIHASTKGKTFSAEEAEALHRLMESKK